MEEKKPKPAAKKEHRYLRTSFASLFGVIAVVLTLAAICTVWLNRTLTDTPTFVNTVAPMLEKPEIQQFVARRAADSIVSSAPVNDLASTLLTPEQRSTQKAGQIRSLVESALETQIIRVIQNPVFINTWRNSLETAHAQTIAALRTNSDEVTFDLSPVVQQAIQQLQKTDLGGAAKKIEIDPKEAKITVHRNNLGPIAKAYDSLQNSMIVLLLGALVAAVASVILSVHHMKTLRRVLMGTGIVSLVIFLLLNLPNVVKTHGIDPVDQAAIVAIADSVFSNLKIALLAIGIICIAAALLSKLFEYRKKPATS